MKKLIQYTITAMAVIAVASCEEDVPTLFNESNGIYFSAKEDSLFYTFAKYPSRVKDTLRLPVTVLGQAAAVDRTISVVSATGNGANATENTHFKLLPPYTLPAGQISTTIPVVIYKTGDLDSLTRTFRLQINANDHFQAGISSKTSMKVSVVFLQKPPSWGDLGGSQWAGYSANFGTWTKTKYKMILEALYDPVSDTTVSEFNFSRFAAPAISIQYMTMVKNYLRANYPGNFTVPVGIGPTLRDPDAGNNVVLVGPANY